MRRRAMQGHVDTRSLLCGPYTPPPTRVGRTVKCLFNGKVTVCGWSDGRIPWPMGRVGHGGRGAYVMTLELARAVRCESEAAICYWWGVGTATVTAWRRRLGVGRMNGGTRHLYSLWKPSKLPNPAVAFNRQALREHRLALGMTQRDVASAMGWGSRNTYGQLESGRRRRALPQTLRRLAAVLGCRVQDLRPRHGK